MVIRTVDAAPKEPPVAKSTRRFLWLGVAANLVVLAILLTRDTTSSATSSSPLESDRISASTLRQLVQRHDSDNTMMMGSKFIDHEETIRSMPLAATSTGVDSEAWNGSVERVRHLKKGKEGKKASKKDRPRPAAAFISASRAPIPAVVSQAPIGSSAVTGTVTPARPRPVNAKKTKSKSNKKAKKVKRNKRTNRLTNNLASRAPVPLMVSNTRSNVLQTQSVQAQDVGDIVLRW